MLEYYGKNCVVYPIERNKKNHNKLVEPVAFPPNTKDLYSWRSTSISKKRSLAIKELAKLLEDTGRIDSIAGPVLSGALFAQAIADNSSNLKANYINKTMSCGPKRHTYKIMVNNWVLVDDIIERGTSLGRISKEIKTVPKAIIVFVIFFSKAWIPERWRDVPVFLLRSRFYTND